MYRLLIVEDEASIREGLSNYIPWENWGFEIISQCENGLQALEFVKCNQVDVMLCDVKMPGMNGIELVKAISENNLDIKTVFLSGYRDFEYVRQALIYGVKDYIVKPTKYHELVEVFSRIKAELEQTTVAKTGEKEPHKLPGGCNYNEHIIPIVKSYVLEHYQDASLENASVLVHMNPFYLSKFFKEKTGGNFSDFVLSVRMKKAVELLNDSDNRICDVSEEVGYSNPKNFTRTFKKYYGKTPKSYRNR